MNEAPRDCDLCPVLDHVRAVHTYTDPSGNVWRLCQRHWQPIGNWLNKRGGK